MEKLQLWTNGEVIAAIEVGRIPTVPKPGLFARWLHRPSPNWRMVRGDTVVFVVDEAGIRRPFNAKDLADRSRPGVVAERSEFKLKYPLPGGKP